MKSFGGKKGSNKVKIPDKAKKVWMAVKGKKKKKNLEGKKINLMRRLNYGNTSPGEI